MTPDQTPPAPTQCSMPSCIVAFHVTCAFDHNLEMRTILAENDEVRFKSFCLEHSCTASGSPPGLAGVSNGNHPPDQRAAPHPASVSAAERAERDQLEREKVSLRKQKLQQLEDEFYRLVDPRELADNLELPVFQVREPTQINPWEVWNGL